MFKTSVIFSVRSTSESCMLIICVVFVSILFTYCSLKFSVSSSLIVISACSDLSTSFLKSKSGSRIDEGCDALFFIAIFLNWGVRVIPKISVIWCFYNHECSVKMLFELVFRLFGVVYFFQNQTFLKILA